MGQVTLETVFGGALPVQTITTNGSIVWWWNRRLQAFRANNPGLVMIIHSATDYPAMPHGMFALWIVNMKDSANSFTVRDVPNSFAVILAPGQAVLVSRFGDPAAWIPTTQFTVL
jgi:hypothetical protein